MQSEKTPQQPGYISNPRQEADRLSEWIESIATDETRTPNDVPAHVVITRAIQCAAMRDQHPDALLAAFVSLAAWIARANWPELVIASQQGGLEALQ